jgi:hypothetical protein
MAIIEINARVSALEEKRSSEQDEKEASHNVVYHNKKRKIDDVFVGFTTIDGKDIRIKKFKRNRNKTEEEAKSTVRRAEEILSSHNVKVTKENITFMGIGSTFASKYRTK